MGGNGLDGYVCKIELIEAVREGGRSGVEYDVGGLV